MSGSISAALLGALARRGRIAAVLTGLAALGLTALIAQQGIDRDGLPRQMESIAICAVLWVLTAVLLFGGNVWARDTRFAPMKLPDLLAALNDHPRPYVVCLDCKLLVPFEASVGTCPRCEQRSTCMEVNGAADIAAVRNALNA